MNWKRIIGLILTALGIYLIVYSIHATHELNEAKGMATDIENFFTHNPSLWDPLIKFFGGKAQEEVSSHDLPVMIMLISGVLLTIGGMTVTIFSWHKPTRK